MPSRFKYVLGVFALALSLALASAPARAAAEGSFDRTLKVTGPVQLEVSTGSGYINVRTGGSSTVGIHGIIRASNNGWFGSGVDAEEKVRRLEKNPPIEQVGNLIRIGHIEDESLQRNISISYELVVPVETELKSSTGSGNMSVEGVRGPVRASTGSGGLKMSGIGDELRATTGSGDVQISSVKGDVQTTTGSGSIHATGVAGAFRASTGSGDVHVEQTASGRVEMGTGSGSIEVSGVEGSLRAHAGSGNITAEGKPSGDWSLHTGSGTLNIRVASNAGFDLYAHTSSGHITTDLPVTVQGTVGRGEMRGKVRGGGALIDARTGSGNIHVE